MSLSYSLHHVSANINIFLMKVNYQCSVKKKEPGIKPNSFNLQIMFITPPFLGNLSKAEFT